ncbi:MAG TPA: DUF3857 domain-containing protein [Cyclobacteriaceae bacterium]|nr:DUF3857 domain-containing protein [Cyclobacteriaceae bacterium]
MHIKKLVFTGLLLSSLLSASYSQKSPLKFGDIAIEDLQMISYENDTSAAAVILLDYGYAYVTFNPGISFLTYERHVRIKILKKEGFKWADAAIQLYHSGSSKETTSKIRAVTYNYENGKVVESKLGNDGIFTEKFNRNNNLQKFTLPNVKEGSIIEYSYSVRSDFIANFPNWQFQYSIPVKHSEYWAAIPDFFVMEKYMQGYLSAQYKVVDKPKGNYNDKLHHWIVRDAPAFKAEPYMTSEKDYISKINFALAYINIPGQPNKEIMGSWKKLNDDLLEAETFGAVISKSNYLQKTVDGLVTDITDPMEKASVIYDYVRRNILWDGQNDFLADSPKDILDKKKGTTGDINITLAAMLKKAGLDIDMVLISTRDHGFVRKAYPMTKQFNYVVCLARIDGQNYFLDATERQIPIGILPERCLNGQGLVISRSHHGWIDLETKMKSRTTVQADLAMDKSGELSGNITYLRDGYDAANMRRVYYAKGEQDYVKDSFTNRVNWSIANSSFENIELIGQTVNETHELSIIDHAIVAGNMIYISPFITDRIERNPFNLEKREYPVDYGSLRERIYTVNLTIPEGYEIDELPQTKIFALPGNAAKYTYSVNVNGNKVNITSILQINKSIFLQDEYSRLRDFYGQVVAKQAEQIVLKNK